MYNKVAHQKYLMFLECARRVTDKKVADPHKDTTIILNELLADEAWLNQVSLFLFYLIIILKILLLCLNNIVNYNDIMSCNVIILKINNDVF